MANSASGKIVQTITGTDRVAGWCFSRPNTSHPPTPGIMTSRMIARG
jgi:hypothetical protein